MIGLAVIFACLFFQDFLEENIQKTLLISDSPLSDFHFSQTKALVLRHFCFVPIRLR